MKTKTYLMPISLVIFLNILVTPILAQVNIIDSLYSTLKMQKEDSFKVKSLIDLSKAYLNISSDTAIIFASQAKVIAEKIKFGKGTANALKFIGIAYYNEGNYLDALSNWNKSLSMFEAIGDITGAANMYSNIGAIYFTRGDDEPALYNFLKALHLAEKINDKNRIATLCSNLGALYSRKPDTYNKALEYLVRGLAISEELEDKELIGSICLNLGDLYINRKIEDSAIYYLNKAIQNWKDNRNLPVAFTYLGKAYTNKKQYGIARERFKESFELATKFNSNLDLAQSLLGLANINFLEQKFIQAINNFEQVVLLASDMNAKAELKDAYFGLAKSHSNISEFKQAYSYMNKYTIIKDSLYNSDIDRKLSGLDYTYNIKSKESQINLLQKEKELQNLSLRKEKSAKNWITTALGLIFIIAIIIFRFYRAKNKTNSILNRQNHEINEAYGVLKSTQSQLIQSEKMASLGELTAGIAHEIQNPLNFVNNFSDVNKELLVELKDEIKKGNLDEVYALADDVIANEDKINHHGKRADAIVKGMLQHSSSGSGKKEPTDINALADEYLRLAYHGLRAKDKSFNATLKTDFDETIGNINIVPQDIGRVILNLITNAFYAVNEKNLSTVASLPIGQAGPTAVKYEPTVSISTKKINDKVEIKVTDNGNGISQNIIDKIFQPFFTTKPTGQGTGLGLSMSYDIVKVHGGDLKVETKERDGSTFIIKLPVV